jgi:hypothetical protein
VESHRLKSYSAPAGSNGCVRGFIHDFNTAMTATQSGLGSLQPFPATKRPRNYSMGITGQVETFKATCRIIGAGLSTPVFWDPSPAS